MEEMAPDKEQAADQSIEIWYKQTVSKLYRFIYSRLQNHEEVEDITQETYARCLRTYTGHTKWPPYSYLKQAAQNLMIDRYRHLNAHPIQALSQEIAEEKLTEEDFTARMLIQDLMRQLPLEYRLVIQLRIVEGYSRKETAERMGRSEDAVRGLQYRAIQTLRQLMANTKED